MTLLQIGQTPGPSKWTTSEQLRWHASHFGPNHLGLIAADLVQGRLGLWKLPMRLASAAAKVSFGYVHTACHLSDRNRFEIECGSKQLTDFHNGHGPVSDEAILRFVDKVGLGRIVVVINNRSHGIRVVAAG